jgi:hypothetical protein
VVRRGFLGKYSSFSMHLSTRTPRPSFLVLCFSPYSVFLFFCVCAIYRSVCVLNKRNKSNKEENDKVKNRNWKEGMAQNASRP